MPVENEPSLLAAIQTSATSEIFDDIDQLEGHKMLIWNSSVYKLVDMVWCFIF